MITKVGIGQDSHKFCKEPYPKDRQLILGGVVFEGEPPLEGNSDADVILHALCNAISGITGKPILGAVADEMCRRGITDSKEYVRRALKDLKGTIVHISFSIEAKRPKFAPKIDLIRDSIATLLEMDISNVALTATTGEGLTAFGRGEGIQVFCVLTVSENYVVDDEAVLYLNDINWRK
jgi:2-C-methyl-D-erythritol 2,4-cyclodiphosphate synthase